MPNAYVAAEGTIHVPTRPILTGMLLKDTDKDSVGFFGFSEHILECPRALDIAVAGDVYEDGVIVEFGKRWRTLPFFADTLAALFEKIRGPHEEEHNKN